MSSILLFRVKCATQYNQSVVIVGNTQELGNWNPVKGLKLSTHPEMYPLWTLDQSVYFEQNQLVEFKLVIVDGANYHWESLPNRCLRIQNLKQLVVLTFNNPNHTLQCLQTLISESDLQELHLAKRRRIRNFQFEENLDSETDNNDKESDFLSLFKEESVSDMDWPMSPGVGQIIITEFSDVSFVGKANSTAF